MMEAYDAYKLYLGLKLHFQDEKYNFVRFKGGVRSSPESFYKRKDRWFFEKLIRRYRGEQVKELLLDSVDRFDNLFVKGEQYPIILQKLYQGDIQLETFLILNQMLNFFPQFDKELDEYQWPVTRKLCNKYSSFLTVNLKKYREIVRKELDI